MIHKQVIAHAKIITVPHGSNFIKVAYQEGNLTVWYAFTPTATKPDVSMEIAIVGTGWDFDPEGWMALGSVFDGPFVWHVFLRLAE